MNHGKILAVIVLAAFFLAIAKPVSAQNNSAVLYVNESCGHCRMYLSNLKVLLEKEGFLIEEKNMVNDESARKEWVSFHEKNGIPIEFRGHLTAILNDSLAIEGHVPLSLVTQTLEKYPDKDFPLLALYQDEMVDEDQVESYKIWSPQSAVQCAPEQKLEECTKLPQNDNQEGIFLSGLVAFSGLVAGFHPCTIGVLLFFLAFLFSIQLLRKNALKIGAAYIAGVFLAYFLIGLGLLQAMVFTEPHFAARASAVLVFLIGAFNILRYFAPQIKGFSLPSFSKKFVAESAEKASMPTAFLVGLVVGMCSFGCTAGIYFSVLGFMATAPATGIPLLLLYNLMFVAPLILILIIATSPSAVGKLEEIQAKHSRKVFLAGGILMVLSAIALWLYTGGA
ncbi:MAG: hypothetical protein HY392_03400 [Candidatus Diapherotrites archaeon]|nr:hypothetical protein [Candidatus Diapherotrites archaeon]